MSLICEREKLVLLFEYGDILSSKFSDSKRFFWTVFFKITFEIVTVHIIAENDYNILDNFLHWQSQSAVLLTQNTEILNLCCLCK